MAKKVSDENLLEMLLVHGGVKGAASALGISQNAIYKRMQDETFKMQYDMMQGVMLTTAATAMTNALDDAIGALVEVIRDKNTNASVRVSAAHSLLTHCNRYIETASIMRRLDALEQAQGEE